LRKILIVEDNPRNMRLIKMVLGNKGYSLFEATDGEEALAVAKEQRPDLIIMDIQLPKMDGLEVTRRLRRIPEFSQVPIIALTASAMEGDRDKIIEAGCDIYVSKPMDTRQLPELVAEMLRGGRYSPSLVGDGSGRENLGS
jgi:two-component system cell cycle response regulator DivK